MSTEKQEKNEAPKDKSKSAHANSIIKNHMIWSMGAGFIPVPIADFFAVSAIQLDMIRQLSKVYDINFEETKGKAIVTTLTGSGLARLGARAIKFIPVVGSVIGGVTLSVLSGASTYAVGEVFKTHFEHGGTFLDFDPERLKKYYNEKFEKGKNMAKEMDEKEKKQYKDAETALNNMDEDVDNDLVAPKPIKDLVKQLESITQMKKEGLLTEEEFNTLKDKIMKAKDEGAA